MNGDWKIIYLKPLKYLNIYLLKKAEMFIINIQKSLDILNTYYIIFILPLIDFDNKR
jgi:hypothetical protein